MKRSSELTGSYAELYERFSSVLTSTEFNDGCSLCNYRCSDGAVTPLAATNVALGAASYNLDPTLLATYTAAAQAGLVPATAVASYR